MAKNNRQHERFKAPKDTFIIVSPGTDNERKVQLIDISRGGAAFIYQGSREELDASGVLKLLAREDPDLETVNFETVRDEPVSRPAETPLPSRRRGVKFKWLRVLQEKDLRDFVKGIGTGR